MKVVDGGYMSWVFGSDVKRIQLWNSSAKTSYSMWNNTVIIMEGGNLFRNEYYGDYKLHRKEVVKKDPAARARRLRVKLFTETMEQDGTLNTIKFFGLEADDIIAAWSVLNWQKHTQPMELIAIDKDYLQLRPMVNICKTDGVEINFEGWVNKMQKKLQPVLSRYWHVVMMLALMGDTSDNVPRLIPPYKLQIVLDILETHNPWLAAYDRYQDDFIRNLYLTVLPGAWCFEPTPNADDCFEIIASGGLYAWYDMPMRKDITESFEVNHEGNYSIKGESK